MKKIFILILSFIIIGCIVEPETNIDTNKESSFNKPIIIRPIITNIEEKTTYSGEFPLKHVFIEWKCNLTEIENFSIYRNVVGSTIWKEVKIIKYNIYSEYRIYKNADLNVGVYTGALLAYKIKVKTIYGEEYYSDEMQLFLE